MKPRKSISLLSIIKMTTLSMRKIRLRLNNMSVKDSLFVLYLNRHIKDSLVFTIQEKCTMIIDSSSVNAKFNQLIKERETAI